jgi:hypothetical protein
MMEVEDTQDVVQPKFDPNLVCGEEFSVPKFVPSRVILLAPKFATSPSAMREMTGASKLKMGRAVPVPPPTVALVSSFAPYVAIEHATDVTDDHAAVWHMAPPMCTIGVESTGAKLRPRKVKLAELDAGMLLPNTQTCAVTTGASNERAKDRM